MALSTRKKNIIIADWKTGAFTKKELEKKHKISFKTLDKLISGIMATNADAVSVLHDAEMVKNSIKNPVELKAVENVVKSRLKVDNITNKILDKIDKFVDGGKVQKVVTEGHGKGFSRAEIVETDLQPIDYKNLVDAVDKASITIGANKRFNENASVQIANQNVQENKEIPTINIIKDTGS